MGHGKRKCRKGIPHSERGSQCKSHKEKGRAMPTDKITSGNFLQVPQTQVSGRKKTFSIELYDKNTKSEDLKKLVNGTVDYISKNCNTKYLTEDLRKKLTHTSACLALFCYHENEDLADLASKGFSRLYETGNKQAKLLLEAAARIALGHIDSTYKDTFKNYIKLGKGMSEKNEPPLSFCEIVEIALDNEIKRKWKEDPTTYCLFRDNTLALEKYRKYVAEFREEAQEELIKELLKTMDSSPLEEQGDGSPITKKPNLFQSVSEHVGEVNCNIVDIDVINPVNNKTEIPVQLQKTKSVPTPKKTKKTVNKDVKTQKNVLKSNKKKNTKTLNENKFKIMSRFDFNSTPLNYIDKNVYYLSSEFGIQKLTISKEYLRYASQGEEFSRETYRRMEQDRQTTPRHIDSAWGDDLVLLRNFQVGNPETNEVYLYKTTIKYVPIEETPLNDSKWKQKLKKTLGMY